jgi:hypothetical protein
VKTSRLFPNFPILQASERKGQNPGGGYTYRGENATRNHVVNGRRGEKGNTLKLCYAPSFGAANIFLFPFVFFVLAFFFATPAKW